jgi:cytochrome c oxidase cbb3-type subunit 4
MFKHYFEGIKGIANYPIFSLIVFLVFFVSLTFWVIRASKGYINHMENLPLDDPKQ